MTASLPRVGVLALQGNFDSHQKVLTELGASVLQVRTASDLEAVSGIVLPGGESTAMLKLMSDEFREALRSEISSGLPTLATCAGAILLADKVSNPEQESLKLLNVDIERNAYGRQLDSFVERTLSLTPSGKETFKGHTELEGVFIRAPRFTRIGENVEVLATEAADPVLVRQGNLLAATFHPELSEGKALVHHEFLSHVG